MVQRMRSAPADSRSSAPHSLASIDALTPAPDATVTRRSAIAYGAAALGVSAGAIPQGAERPGQDPKPVPAAKSAGATIRGALSGKPVFLPDVNEPPIPVISPEGPVLDGARAPGFDAAALSAGLPDACNHRRRFGLLLPATNTTMESELWTILVKNRDRGLDGIGVHSSPVLTPKPDLGTPAGLERYKQDFLTGVANARASALLARPQYLLMGMSLEHILAGIEPIRATMAQLAQGCALSWSTWHDAAKAALDRYGARRIGLITPFQAPGNESAARMFRELGFEVVTSFGFCCANAQHIAHIPDEAKERAITELLATPANRLDAVVQCGTNMSMTAVAERLEPRIGIPILGINATLLWHALRETGITARAEHAGRLLREH